MLTKLEINGIKIESDEGVERVFSMLKNIKDFNLENIGKEDIQNNNGDSDELKKEIVNKDKHISSLEKSVTTLNNNIKDLKSENEKLNKENTGLKEEKEKYLSEIKNLQKEINGLRKELEEVKSKKSEMTVVLDEQPKPKKEVETETTKPEEKTQVDFNPNNANDIAWLKNELGNNDSDVKVATPIPNPIPTTESQITPSPQGEVINGIKVIKDDKTGEIIQLDEYVLTLHEKTLLKVGLTTPEKIISNRRTMKESDEIIAHGWGD